MSKALKELTESYSDLLIRALELSNPGKLLVDVLVSIEDTQVYIEKGLLK
jgi:hypothetical protein